MNKSDNELFKLLENKLDVFIEKGLHLSKDLTQDDRENLIMKVITELIETAVKNIKEKENLSEEELIERKNQIIEVIKKYYERKLKEYKEKNL